MPASPLPFEINRPTLLLDKEKCVQNIGRLADKARKSNVKLRPHFKTHQSHEVGRWMRAYGVSACTVSSLEMAGYFSDDGWDDITVAFPLNYLEVDRINALASKTKLNLLVSVPGVLPLLLQKLEREVGIFIDIDTGYHRTGFAPQDHAGLERVLAEIGASPYLKMEGFLSHAGHTYSCRSKPEISTIHLEEVRLLNELKSKYGPQHPGLKLSVGDTPSASVMDVFTGVDEVRAGNLVFYDLVQSRIGSCGPSQIALALACPVVATYPARNEVVVYGGAVHFSKDFIMDENGLASYGAVVPLARTGWEMPPTGMYVKALSQEHGIVHASGADIQMVKPGDLLGILPVHSCLTADAMGGYVTLEGERISRLASS